MISDSTQKWVFVHFYDFLQYFTQMLLYNYVLTVKTRRYSLVSERGHGGLLFYNDVRTIYSFEFW